MFKSFKPFKPFNSFLGEPAVGTGDKSPSENLLNGEQRLSELNDLNRFNARSALNFFPLMRQVID